MKYCLFEQVSPGYGFDAIAIAFLSRGNVFGIVLTSLLFGATEALQLRIQALGANIPYQFLLMLPNLIAILALASKSTPPKALGIPYFKSDISDV